MRQHHSAVELIDRAAAAGLVERRADACDRRLTRIRLTAGGEAALTSLTPAHLDELRALDLILHQLASDRDGADR